LEVDMPYTDDLRASDDAEQAAYVSEHIIHLPYDASTGLILAGPHRGLPVVDMLHAEVTVHCRKGHDVAALQTTIRPWWRLWSETPCWRLRVLPAQRMPNLPMFAQVFDDGGAS
jgi:hypothetical protein